MLFTKGQKIFAIVFIVSFIIMLFKAYQSDAAVHKANYKNVWVILVSMVIILAALVALIKILH